MVSCHCEKKQAHASSVCVYCRLPLGNRGASLAIDGVTRLDLKGRWAEALADDQHIHNYCSGAGIPCRGFTCG